MDNDELQQMNTDQVRSAIQERTAELDQLKHRLSRLSKGKSQMCQKGLHDKGLVGVVIRKDGAVLCRGCEHDRYRRYYLKKKEAAHE